jgi:hypothetical protein
MQSPFYKQNKIVKVDISLKQLLDVDTTNELYYRRTDNIFPNQVLTSYTNVSRRDAFRFKYLTDLIVAGSGVTITNLDGILTISSTGGGGGTYTVDNGLTENPANNFQLGGALTGYTQIDGASNTYGIDFIDLLTFGVQAFERSRLFVSDGVINSYLDLDVAVGYTKLGYTNGVGSTEIEMIGSRMYIRTPNYNSSSNGDVLTLIDSGTGRVEYQTPTTTAGDSLSPLLLMGG